MPKMMLFAVAASGAVAGAAATYLAAGRSIFTSTAGGSPGSTSIMDRARSLSADASDKVRAATWNMRRSKSTTDSAFNMYRTEILNQMQGEYRQLRDDLRRLSLANDRTEFDAIVMARNRHPQDNHGTQSPPAAFTE